jgi:hypothetical protein
MNATSLKTATTLTPIIGYSDQQQKLTTLTKLLWNIAYTALWNGSIFSTQEKTNTLDAIKAYLVHEDNLEHAYTEMVQRILITRRYLQKDPQRFVPLPSIWFEATNIYGYNGTASWFADIRLTRLSLPLYKLSLKAFAEAILEMAEEPGAKNFHYWREYFIERNCQGLLNLFLATVANLNYAVE